MHIKAKDGLFSRIAFVQGKLVSCQKMKIGNYRSLHATIITRTTNNFKTSNAAVRLTSSSAKANNKGSM